MRKLSLCRAIRLRVAVINALNANSANIQSACDPPDKAGFRIEQMTQHLTTEMLAKALNIKPQTLRASLCRNGSYYGIRPVKMPNRLLLWPGDAAERLMSKSEGA